MDFSPFRPKKAKTGKLSKILGKIGLENDEPPLTKVYLEPTTRCNLNCRACMRHSWSEALGDMTPQIFRSFLAGIDRCHKLSTVAFWGFGEPLLHPDIMEMIRQVHDRGLRTEIISNCMLLDDSTADALIAAGLNALTVSVDGATAEAQALYREGAELSRILKNVEAMNDKAKQLGRTDLEIGIEFVLTKGNVGELADLPQLARRIGASFIVASNLLPYAESMKEDILYWLSTRTHTAPQIVHTDPIMLMPALDRNQKGVRRLYERMPELSRGEPMPWSPDSIEGYCTFVERGSVCINREGLVSPCIALMHDHRCFVLGAAKEIKAHHVGDIRTRSMAAIWDDPEFRTFRKRVREFDFSPCANCGGCDMSETNQEDCIGSPFPTCGGCLWAKGILLCP